MIAAKKAGVNNYIVKPFNAQTLQSKINAVLAPAPDLMPTPAFNPPEGFYERVEGAVQETARGRWFMNEHARRTKGADTGPCPDRAA